jgi:hypothetical protein
MTAPVGVGNGIYEARAIHTDGNFTGVVSTTFSAPLYTRPTEIYHLGAAAGGGQSVAPWVGWYWDWNTNTCVHGPNPYWYPRRPGRAAPIRTSD